MWKSAIYAAIIGTLIALCSVTYINRRAKALENRFLSDRNLQNSLLLTSEIIDANENKIGEFSAEQRYFVSLAALPLHIRHAFLAAEDSNFYEHLGFSPLGILRALVANVRAGRIVQGASTITQQLARQLFLQPNRSWQRKLDELALARILEVKLTKDRIFELYLNKIFLGNGSYGVESAARNYFRKSAIDLSVAEAALLAGLVAAPSKYAPNRYYERAKQRQIYVLKRMVAAGYLKASEAQRLTGHKVIVAHQPLRFHESAPYFVEEVREQLRTRLSLPKLNETGLSIRTTLDSHLQKSIRVSFPTAFDAAFRQIRRDGKDQLQGAMVAMDMQNGQVLAMQGGWDFGESQFNRSTMLNRPLGSLYMPLYMALSLDRGFNLVSSVYDEGKVVLPRLDLKMRVDNLSIYESLYYARAAESARLFAWLGAGTVADINQQLGFNFTKQDLGLALGYGTADPLTTLGAFTTLVNGGRRLATSLVEEIRDRQGQVIYKAPRIAPKEVVTPASAFMVYSTLLDSSRQGAARVEPGLQGRFATMVGTNESLHDGWFIGFNRRIGILMWVGSEYGKTRLASNEEQLRRTLSFVWSRVVSQLPPHYLEDGEVDPPSEISYVKLPYNNDTGKIAFLPFKIGQEPF